mmetsp:Transcript_19128/g.40911  ORF Transcript_19128/g.40911 Transcript_19128/m.40911 type:complete len:135 (+) Transcript_19128:136-540(+)
MLIEVSGSAGIPPSTDGKSIVLMSPCHSSDPLVVTVSTGVDGLVGIDATSPGSVASRGKDPGGGGGGDTEDGDFFLQYIPPATDIPRSRSIAPDAAIAAALAALLLPPSFTIGDAVGVWVGFCDSVGELPEIGG